MAVILGVFHGFESSGAIAVNQNIQIQIWVVLQRSEYWCYIKIYCYYKFIVPKKIVPKKFPVLWINTLENFV